MHEWVSEPVELPPDELGIDVPIWAGTCVCGEGWSSGSREDLQSAFDAHV